MNINPSGTYMRKSGGDGGRIRIRIKSRFHLQSLRKQNNFLLSFPLCSQLKNKTCTYMQYLCHPKLPFVLCNNKEERYDVQNFCLLF